MSMAIVFEISNLVEETKKTREVLIGVKSEIANLTGCLNEILWEIRSENRHRKTCGSNKKGEVVA